MRPLNVEKEITENVTMQAKLTVLSSGELARARATGVLHLSYRRLSRIPPEVFSLLPELRTLDLGFNRLQELDPRICELLALEQLWLNNNPLCSLPASLEKNRKLRVVDLRCTRLRRLPNEMGRLTHVHTVDLDGTQLKPKQWAPYREGGTEALMAHLHMRDQRKQAKLKMLARMREGVYRELWDLPGGEEQVMGLIKQVFLCFEDLEDIKNLIRNAERLFPDDIEDVDIERIRHEFETLRRENERKKLAAELELKIRVIYFDRIRVDKVEGMVHDIYREVHDLEDIKFLIFFATKLFPATAAEVTGELIWQNIIDLQTLMAKERADAIRGVETALKGVYPHVNPSRLVPLCEDTTSLFKRVVDLKKLAADANTFFPAEFDAANPKQIRRAFVIAKRAAEAEDA